MWAFHVADTTCTTPVSVSAPSAQPLVEPVDHVANRCMWQGKNSWLGKPGWPRSKGFYGICLCYFLLSPLLSTPEEIAIFGGVGLGWGGVVHINVRQHLRHEVDASWLMWGGVGHINIRQHLRHEVDASWLMWGRVGWGMLTFACTCVAKLMLRV